MNSGLKFLTLNCWGLPFITPRRSRRIAAIAETIKKGRWDVVALQEVWLQGDQDFIIQNSGFEHSVVFRGEGRLFGSGLLLLSRFKILDHDFHSFKVTGFPHRLFEGDFHSSKGVGYALIQTPLGDIPVFVTHLMAKYVRRNEEDTNRVFRMAQILELILYIRRTVSPRSFVLCGDLNATEDDLEIETILSLSGQPLRTLLNPKLNAKRIDHIICGATYKKLEYRISGAQMVLRPERGGGSPIYSDHPGVAVVIRHFLRDCVNKDVQRVLERSLRYMSFSMEIMTRIERRLRWIPVLGWVINYFMAPQIAYIKQLLDLLEQDVRHNASEYPLRLGSASSS